MRIKMTGGKYSELRDMPGGAPQGTKCGNLLFCIATAFLHHTLDDDAPSHRPLDTSTDSLGLSDLAERLHDERPSSPLGGSSLDLRMSGKVTILEDDFPCVPPDHDPPPRWSKKPVLVSKFIDDINAREKNDITGARSIFSTNKEQRYIHATQCQRFLETVTANASRIGMRVNQAKTQLLCTTTAINCLLYTSPSPRDRQKSRMPSSA